MVRRRWCLGSFEWCSLRRPGLNGRVVQRCLCSLNSVKLFRDDRIAHERFDIEPADKGAAQEAQEQPEDDWRKVDATEMGEVFADEIADGFEQRLEQARQCGIDVIDQRTGA